MREKWDVAGWANMASRSKIHSSKPQLEPNAIDSVEVRASSESSEAAGMDGERQRLQGSMLNERKSSASSRHLVAVTESPHCGEFEIPQNADELRHESDDIVWSKWSVGGHYL